MYINKAICGHFCLFVPFFNFLIIFQTGTTCLEFSICWIANIYLWWISHNSYRICMVSPPLFEYRWGLEIHAGVVLVHSAEECPQVGCYHLYNEETGTKTTESFRNHWVWYKQNVLSATIWWQMRNTSSLQKKLECFEREGLLRQLQDIKRDLDQDFISFFSFFFCMRYVCAFFKYLYTNNVKD